MVVIDVQQACLKCGSIWQQNIDISLHVNLSHIVCIHTVQHKSAFIITIQSAEKDNQNCLPEQVFVLGATNLSPENMNTAVVRRFQEVND